MKNDAFMTLEKLSSFLSYDLKTGIFTWKPRPSNSQFRHAGKRAGAIDTNGHVRICICGKGFMAHRLAWLFVTGRWPDVEVDHRNRNGSDNRWENLREATHAQNLANNDSYAASRAASGRKKGVYSRPNGKWQAKLNHNGRMIHLGTFPDQEEAHSAYLAAAMRLRGEFYPEVSP